MESLWSHAGQGLLIRKNINIVRSYLEKKIRIVPGIVSPQLVLSQIRKKQSPPANHGYSVLIKRLFIITETRFGYCSLELCGGKRG